MSQHQPNFEASQYEGLDYGGVGEKRERAIELSTHVLDLENKPALEQVEEVFKQMYLFYKLKQLDTPEAMAAKRDEATAEEIQAFVASVKDDFFDAFEMVKAQIASGNTIITYALAEEEVTTKGDPIPKGSVISFTHGMKTVNPLSGRTDYMVEGTWTIDGAKLGGAGTRVLAELQQAALDQWGAEGLFWWTFGKNPNTTRPFPEVVAKLKEAHVEEDNFPGFYNRIKNIEGQSRASQVGIADATTRTAEQMYIIPLCPRELHVRTGYDARNFEDPVLNPSQLCDNLIVIPCDQLADSGPDYDKFQELYYRFKDMNGDTRLGSEKAAEQFLENLASHGLENFRVLIHEKDSEPIAMTLVSKEGPKLPRDPYLSADIRAFYLDPDAELSQGVVNEILSDIAEACMEDGHKVIRMVLPPEHPAKAYMEDAQIEVADGAFVHAKESPWRIFRLGLTKESRYAEGIPPHMPNAAQQEKIRSVLQG